ncbi:O-antigen ligase family protein [Patescibacteria group bacterium]|nr:O-antigen ligase family protein [Patescibacteria group bacterium]
MQRLRLTKILDLLIEAGWLAVIFFVPLYFAVFFKTNDVFELNKIILFKIFVLLLLFFSLFKLIWNVANFPKILPFCHSRASGNPGESRENLASWRKYLLIPFLFLLSLVAATLLSKNIGLSYYGSYSRFQGLETHFYYLLFFILLLLNLESDKQIYRIIIAIALSSFFICVYGLLQIAGLDFFDWNEPVYITHRVTSTLGQPNFLASYLLLAIPATAYLINSPKKFLYKFSWAILLIFQLACLFFTYSRAGWLGLFFGVIFSGLVYLFAKKKFALKLLNKKALGSALLIIVMAASCFSLLFYCNAMFKARIKSIVDFNGAGAATRMAFWQAGIDIIKKKPLFGYGLDNQGEELVKYYKKDWARTGWVNDFPDRAHNLFLDTLITTGIVGFLFYLALLYLFFKLIIENIKNNNSAFLSWLILTALISYLISLMFGFSIVATNVYFWLYFAIIIVINRNYGQIRESSKTPLCHSRESGNPGANRKNLFISLIKIILLFLIAMAVFYQANYEIKHLIADQYFRELKIASANQEYYKAYELYGYIKDEKINDGYYENFFAAVLADWYGGFNSKVFTIQGEKILKDMEQNIKGERFADYLAKAKIYTALAREKNDNYFNLAEENFNKAIGLSPEMPKVYRELAKMYYKKGDYDNVIANYNKALACLPALDKNIDVLHKNAVNFEQYLIYKGMAEAYLKQKNYEEAEKNYWLAYYNNITDIVLFKKIADTYYMRGDLDKAVFYNKRGMMLSPKDYVWPYAIALLYQEKGDKDKALEYAEQALNLEPENELVKIIIKNLK